MTRAALHAITTFAATAGRAAAESARKGSTADRAWRGWAPRLDSLVGIGPRRLEALRAVFVAAYEAEQLEQLAARAVQIDADVVHYPRTVIALCRALTANTNTRTA